ncbi:MAG TPA: hypothetical protein VEY95_07505 [Azospirillaceae bacterium]|nr:hypothetical protein [Azospirillaceae bacterium]
MSATRLALLMIGTWLGLAADPALAQQPQWVSPSFAPVCQAETLRELARLGIPQTDVRDLNVSSLVNGSFNPRITQYQGWARLSSCQGSVVVVMDDSCRPMSYFTRGGCNIPGR